MATEQKQKAEDFNFTTAHPCAYADIMAPRAFEKNGQKKGEPKYSGTFIIDYAKDPEGRYILDEKGRKTDHPDLKRLKAEVVAMLKSHNKTGKQLKIGRLTEEQEAAGTHIEVQVPWKEGTKEADRMKAKGKDGEAFRDRQLLKATSKFPPALAAAENGKIVELPAVDNVQPPAAAKYFYSGAHLVPSFGLHWYKGDEGKPDGVSLYFNAALFAKHGNRLGGRTANAAETFKGYIGSISQEDTTGGAPVDELDDEIPF